MILILSGFNIWYIIGISVFFLFGFITIIFVCTCWNRVRRNTKLYNIEDPRPDSGLFTFYRRFSAKHKSDINKLLTGPSTVDNLVDSMDRSNEFTNSLLRLNSQTDEMCSCISNESLGTFYSTGHVSRASSKRSFVSCSEGSRDGDMV